MTKALFLAAIWVILIVKSVLFGGVIPPMKNLPNILTLVRIACAGVFAYFFVCHQYNACVITFIISMVSDVLDGAIARKYGCVSDLGKVLDPLADKITLLVVSVCFYTEGWIIWPMLAAVIIKESLMIIGGLIMLRSNVVAYSDRFGKASTVLFCASITMALLEKSPLPLLLRRICGLSTALFCMSIVCSFIALGHYARTQFMRRKA